MSAEPEDVKPKLSLTIKFEDRSIQVKVRKNTKLEKIFTAAEKNFDKTPGTLKFVFQGARLRGDDTAADHDMDDEDQIDAFLAQVGGVRRRL